MPFQTFDVARMVLKCNLPENVEAVNVFHAQYVDGPTLSADDATIQWGSYITEVFEPMVDSIVPEANYYEGVVYRIVPGSDPIQLEIQGFFTPDITGTNINPMLVHGAAPYWTADLDGIGPGTAKKFLAGFNADCHVDSVLITAVLNNVQGGADIWKESFGVGGNAWNPCTFSVAKGVRLPLRVRASRLVGYQRRRKPGVGI